MPAPQGKYSTDILIYKVTQFISTHMCAVSPNTISTIGFLFIIPVILNLLNNGSMAEILFLVFCKQFLDCLDGTVARTCNTQSDFGAKLDIFLDVLFVILVGFVFLHDGRNPLVHLRF